MTGTIFENIIEMTIFTDYQKDGYIQLPDMISIVDEGVYTCEVKNDTHVHEENTMSKFMVSDMTS